MATCSFMAHREGTSNYSGIARLRIDELDTGAELRPVDSYDLRT